MGIGEVVDRNENRIGMTGKEEVKEDVKEGSKEEVKEGSKEAFKTDVKNEFVEKKPGGKNKTHKLHTKFELKKTFKNRSKN